MIINIIEPKEVTDDEVLEFFFHQVSLGLEFEQFVEYFEAKDLDRVRELWEESEEKWAMDDYDMGYVDEEELRWLEQL